MTLNRSRVDISPCTAVESNFHCFFSGADAANGSSERKAKKAAYIVDVLVNCEPGSAGVVCHAELYTHMQAPPIFISTSFH